MATVLSIIGGVVGGYFGGPWGAAAGSALGEAIGGGDVKQDLTAGALSYIGGEAFGGAGSGLGGASGGAESAGDSFLGGLGGAGASSLGSAEGDILAQTTSSAATDLGGAALASGSDALGSSGLNSLIGAAGGSASGASGDVFGQSGLNSLLGASNGGSSVAGAGLDQGGAAAPFNLGTAGTGVGAGGMNIPATTAQGVAPNPTVANPGQFGTSSAAPVGPPGIGGGNSNLGFDLSSATGQPSSIGGGGGSGDTFGINAGSAGTPATNALGVSSLGSAAVGATPAASSSGLSGIGNSLLGWAEKNPGTAAQLGLGAYEATQKPALPSADKALLSESQANIASATGIINSGGTSSPNWGAQKAAIDQSIQTQVTQGTQAILQQAANNGMGQNSLVVQQQINQLKINASTQQQQLYQQAQAQNVSQAMSLLSGGNQALASIGNTQYQQDQQAQQLVAQLGGAALKAYGQQGATPLPTG